MQKAFFPPFEIFFLMFSFVFFLGALSVLNVYTWMLLGYMDLIHDHLTPIMFSWLGPLSTFTSQETFQDCNAMSPTLSVHADPGWCVILIFKMDQYGSQIMSISREIQNIKFLQITWKRIQLYHVLLSCTVVVGLTQTVERKFQAISYWRTNLTLSKCDRSLKVRQICLHNFVHVWWN